MQQSLLELVAFIYYRECVSLLAKNKKVTLRNISSDENRKYTYHIDH